MKKFLTMMMVVGFAAAIGCSGDDKKKEDKDKDNGKDETSMVITDSAA